MGNSVNKLSQCCSCNGGNQHEMVIDAMQPSPALEFVGHSFTYVRPDSTRLSSSKVHSLNASTETTTYRSISGASIGANPTSASLADSTRSSTLESSDLVSSLYLQPTPRGSPFCLSRSGPVEGGLISGPIDKSDGSSSGSSFKTTKKSLSQIMTTSFKEAIIISNKMLKVSDSDTEQTNESLLSETEQSLADHRNLQWAQGKAGEDRTHIVVSEENGWVFVGVYDGFSGADAPDHLVANLFNSVFDELKGMLLNNDHKDSSSMDHDDERFEQHSDDVLNALSKALSKTEESYMEAADSKPQLHIIGSCVLVMLMKGEDVYLMNVGDSRAILAQQSKSETNRPTKPPLVPRQLTMDHNAEVKEEIERIRKEHPDDENAISNERVKGYLKVTRAFGCGFLKKPKWNDAIYAIFRINYIGTSPYITSSPSLYHHKLSPDDKFLILSSDGLYQYFTNEQVVSELEWFTSTYPDGEPAQHLVEQVLIRAAKKYDLEFHELVEIPPGQRRMYHDDVSVIIISLEGRIWRS